MTRRDIYGRILKRRVRVIRQNRSHRPELSSSFHRLLSRSIPKLPPSGSRLVPMMPVSGGSTGKGMATAGIGGRDVVNKHTPDISSALRMWLRANIPILVLNCGSLCTLLAYTRSDVLELRYLTFIGSCSSVVYFLSRPPPVTLPPAIWAAIFVCTNGFMIRRLWIERDSSDLGSGRETWIPEVEDAYDEHFLPHGVTPRQFGTLIGLADTIELQLGEVLQHQDEAWNDVYLVVRGGTIAHQRAKVTLSRRISAASSNAVNRLKLGGDSGAWIGELTFLRYLEKKDLRQKTKGIGDKSTVKEIQKKAKAVSWVFWNKAFWNKEKQRDEDKGDTPQSKGDLLHTEDDQYERNNRGKKECVNDQQYQPQVSKALLTYRSTEDKTLVLRWSHDSLFKALGNSPAFREAMIRCMTAAVLGKVVNFYSQKQRSNGIGGWIGRIRQWLSKNPNGTGVATNISPQHL